MHFDLFSNSGFTEAIRQAATVPGVEGIDISRKFILDQFDAVRAILEETGLEVASVGAGLSSGTIGARGGFSAEDPEVRRMTIDRVKTSMDYAAEFRADKVCLWFGSFQGSRGSSTLNQTM